MNRTTTMPQKKKRATTQSKPVDAKRTSVKRERIKRFVKSFYSQYGDMMSRLSHE